MVESLQERYLNNQLSEIDNKLSTLLFEALNQASIDGVKQTIKKLRALPPGLDTITNAVSALSEELNTLLGKPGDKADQKLQQVINKISSLVSILTTGFEQLPEIVDLNLDIDDLSKFPKGKSISDVINSKGGKAETIRKNFRNQLGKAFTGKAKQGFAKIGATLSNLFLKSDTAKFYEQPGGLKASELADEIMEAGFEVSEGVYKMVKYLKEPPKVSAGSESGTGDTNKPTDAATTTTTSLADTGKKIDQKIDQLPPINVSDQKKKEIKGKYKSSTEILLSMNQEMINKLSSLKDTTTKSEVEKILSPYKEGYTDSLFKIIKMERIFDEKIIDNVYKTFDSQANKTKINSTKISDDDITIGNLYVTITNKWASDAYNAAIAEIEKSATTGAKSKDDNEPIIKQNPSDDLSAAIEPIIDKLIEKNPELEDLNNEELFQKTFGIGDLDAIRKVINGLTKNGLLKYENLIREKLRKKMLRENSNPRYLLAIENLIREELRKRVIQENLRKNLRRNYRS